MPNCFTLTPKDSSEPAKFSTIDDKMREHFGAPEDKHFYYELWYDIEGLALAMGRDWQWMRNEWPERSAIIDWLASNYTPDSWCER